ncbi:endonuclease [Thermoplasmatales archaeon ex4572_165]|nr:MAG: endonuclease [Thermoplasmatales archaeon ex4572_165]
MHVTPTYIYKKLFAHFGPQQWWPMDRTYHQNHISDPRFEVIIGAILTQNTAWINVEKAIINLKEQKMLSLKTINNSNIDLLKELIKPSGFFNQKAIRLKSISNFLQETYDGNLDTMFSQSVLHLREELLNQHGVGPETADSILLYAGNKAIFVVDAYTKRLCNRLPFQVNSTSYDDIQYFFQNDLRSHFDPEKIVQIYKEFHAIIVELAKNFCLKRNPKCSICPLESICRYDQKSLE